jgi:sugar phosphate isomerase/epimerase
MTAPSPLGPLALCLTSLPLDFPEAVQQTSTLGFTHVEVVARADRPAAHLDALADAGVLVSCAALGRGLPDGHTLDAADVGARRAALDALRQQVADAARLGATRAYLIPGTRDDAVSLAYFAEGCGLLADHAAGRMVRLCVEHVPGRALATAARTLSWLEGVGHANLGLLLSVGHCRIAGEDAADLVRLAGTHLAFLHLDDNYGKGDLPALAAALRDIGYAGGIALALDPRAADPRAALREGKRLVEQRIGGCR